MGHIAIPSLEGESSEIPLARERKRTCQFSYQRDLPMILAVRNAMFISYSQLYEQLRAQGSEANRQGFAWRLNRLVELGVIRKLAQVFPYRGPTYAITRNGLSCLEACGEGLISLTSDSRSLPNESQAAHFLELGEIRSALRGRGLLEKWISDVELKSLNLVLDSPLAKDYDAVADLNLGVGGRLSVGLEYERSIKTAARYGEIVGEIKEEKQIDMLLFLTASQDLVYQLKGILGDMEFPIGVISSRVFCKDPLGVKMHNTLTETTKLSLLEMSSMLDQGTTNRKLAKSIQV
jgi:hypothetical protein